jgi:PEP-CTERM motif
MKFRAASILLSAGLMSASPAHATEALRLEITNALNTWLQVPEVQAFNSANLNVAAALNGGTALGAVPGTWNFASTPDGAINGVVDNVFNFSPNPGDLTMYHPSTEGGANALIVTFAALSDITSIAIFGRVDCCTQRDLYGFRLFDAQNVVVAQGQLDARNSDHFASISLPSAAVPEPATWAMMLGGFGLVGFSMRRKRRNVTTTVAYS